MDATRLEGAATEGSTSADEGWGRVFAFVGSIVFAGVILVYLQAILVPFVLAIFLAYLVRPFAEWISSNLCLCRRHRRRRRPVVHEPHDAEETANLLPPHSEDGEGRAGLPAALERGATMGGMLVEEATVQMERAVPRWVGVLLAMGLAITCARTRVLLPRPSLALCLHRSCLVPSLAETPSLATPPPSHPMILPLRPTLGSLGSLAPTASRPPL